MKTQTVQTSHSSLPLSTIRFRSLYRHVLSDDTGRKSGYYVKISLTLFTLSFFGLFAIRPALITAFSLSKSVSDLQKLNLSYEEKITSIIQAQTAYERVREKLVLIDSAIPQRASFHSLAGKIESLALASDVSIQQMQIDNVPLGGDSAESAFQSFGFTIVGTGRYLSIVSFLDDMLSWRRLVRLEAVDFVPHVSSESALLRMTLKGHAYYEP